MIFDVMLRLEPDPHQRDLARGWAAELADPAWMLGRQWQLGEHQGEDASSPVAVEITRGSTPIRPVAGQEQFDPATMPAQAVLESEPGDWWTAGRRIRVGRAVAAAAQSHGIALPDSARLARLPVPYDGLRRRPGRSHPVAAAHRTRPRRIVVRRGDAAARAGGSLGPGRVELQRQHDSG